LISYSTWSSSSSSNCNSSSICRIMWQGSRCCLLVKLLI